MRMRTINDAFDYVKEIDPNTALTKTALRRLVITGAIPSTRIGQKYLISLENLEAYLSGDLTQPSPAPQIQNGIRRIEV